jgi:type IV pilus assembly protein PilA
MKLFENKGFTLIELLVVVAIIGILAAVAIAIYYPNYLTKTRLTEVTLTMSTVASAVSAYYQDHNNAWPDAIATFTGIRNSLGVNVPAARLAPNGLTIGSNNGVITATVANISSSVDGKGLTLTPGTDGNGAITWTWGAYNGIPDLFIPRQ